MKTKMMLLLVTVLLFTGCDLFKDLGEITISTDLTMNIPVVVSGVKSADAVTIVPSLDFSSSMDLELGDNEDIEPYLEKIREIDIKSLDVTVYGLGAGQTINTISLEVTGVGIICTQTDITSANNTFTPVIDQAKLDEAGAKLKADKKITVTVSGNVSGPMTFTVGLDFETDIVAGALD